MTDLLTRTTHALQPLSEEEIAKAVGILRSERGVDERFRFVEISLAEPEKAALATADATGGDLPRLAKAVLIDRAQRVSIEARVSLTAGAVVDWKRIAEGEPPFTSDEIDGVEIAVRKHPDFIAAMERRGIADLDLVWVDPWTAGSYDDEAEFAGRRMARGLLWKKDAADDLNGYAHPIENVIVMFDLHEMEPVKIYDFGVVRVPEKRGNFAEEDASSLRTDLKPIVITQPDGASFTVEGNLVRWHRWRLRVGFTPREGLVIHTVSWEDDDRVRPIMHRGAVSEMIVPYGDPAVTHAKKNVFDIGELNFGSMANSLTLGCDCLGEIYYFDHAFCDPFGKPYTLKNVICMHEEDFGVQWRHFDWRSNTTEVRRSRRLVISSFSTIGNYDYGFFWYFHLDGTIVCEVKLTGILTTGSVPDGVKPTHGQLLNEDGLYGPIHQHLFNFRLDLDIDGPVNTVIEEHAEADPPGPGNPLNGAFRNVKTVLKTEREAQQLIDPLRGRTWKIINPTVLNAVGEPTGYRLVPHGNVGVFASPEASISKRANFMTKHLWVTPFAEGEVHAAGDYPAQHPGGDGLPTWTAANRSIEETDVVLWYTLGTHHQPRPEDWPVMPVAYTSFHLAPSGFFNQNPTLDLPRPAPHHANGHCGAGCTCGCGS
jgi:primary-amine oxidase